MRTTDMTGLVSCRYGDDIELLKTIRKDPLLVEEQKRIEVLRKRSQMRMRLLGTAVRVTDGMLPVISASIADIGGRVDVGKPLEAFVFADSSINAFVAESSSHFLVGISSGAISVLTIEELEFVIGHELGHALFGHTEVAAGLLVEGGRVSPERSKLLRSWQRAAEISADRVGLLCCGNLSVAGTALVKTLSGLSFGERMDPSIISGQLDALLEEVMDLGADDLWEHSHPFPPIRIKALESYWGHRDRGTPLQADVEIRRFLGYMDPASRGSEASEGSQDGLLSRFLFWGGLFVGTADGPLNALVKQRLDSLTVAGADLDELLASGSDLAAISLERFKAVKQARRAKLKAQELSSLMKQLVAFAALDNHFSEHEKSRLGILGKELGLPESGIALLIQQQLEGN